MNRNWKPNELIRVPAYCGGFRVWRIVGVFLGGEHQESVIEIETLDRTRNTEGRMLIPEELLNASLGSFID